MQGVQATFSTVLLIFSDRYDNLTDAMPFAMLWSCWAIRFAMSHHVGCMRERSVLHPLSSLKSDRCARVCKP